METLKSIITVMHPHQWMAIVDLKDAYFHIRVVPANHQYLRFCWLGESYQFKALPFGLSLAPQVFTKTLAPPLWLGSGSRVCSYTRTSTTSSFWGSHLVR